MAEKFFHSKRYDELRKKAEEKLREITQKFPADNSATQAHELLHELHTHQIELEMQNEELRLAQIELENYRRRFSDLYDFAPVSYLTISDKGIILEANHTACALLGVDRRILTQQPFSLFVFSEDQDIYYKNHQILLDSGNEQNCELRIKTQANELIFVLLKLSINQDIDGETGQHRIIIVDITARKEMEQAIIKGKNEWQETFDATQDFITVQDKNHRIIRANKAAHDLFGVKFGELNHRLCHELFKDTSTPCQDCVLSDESGITRNYTVEFTCKSIGKTLQFSTSPILNDQNKIEKIIHVGRDITAHKAIEEEILQSKKMEATVTLASGIAHNFNNILTAVLGNHELALRNESLPEEVRKYIDVAHFSASKAAKLTEMMLQFVGQKKTVMQQIEVTSFVEEMVKKLSPQINSHISLEDVNDLKLFINSDIRMIREMITNLIINAAEAIDDPDGQISLNIKQRFYSVDELNRTWQSEHLAAKDYVSISITDTGHGMEKEVIDSAFDPFYSKKFTGRGLGLATVLGIVRAHRGTVQLKSKPKHGTTVTVLLPAATPEKQFDEILLPTTSVLGVLRGKVLAVDDDPILQKLLSQLLKKIGLQVLEAGDGIEALEVFNTNKEEIDVILLDVAMPRLSGLEVLAKIREESDVPVIVMTGYSLELISADFSIFSNCGFLQKPFNIDELKRRLNEMLV